MIEFVDNNFDCETHKYVDDLTLIETIPANARAYAEFDPKPVKLFHAPQTEGDIGKLKNTCEQKKLN